MKIKLIAIGKTDDLYLSKGIETYIQRLSHYCSFDLIVINDIKNGHKMEVTKLKEEEGKLIAAKVHVNDYLILLDEHGKHYNSVEFSTTLQKKMNIISTNLIFVIGGPFGFSSRIFERSDEKISLSKMTFPHQMVRLFFLEQLYRSFTILKGEKYHHQ